MKLVNFILYYNEILVYYMDKKAKDGVVPASASRGHSNLPNPDTLFTDYHGSCLLLFSHQEFTTVFIILVVQLLCLLVTLLGLLAHHLSVREANRRPVSPVNPVLDSAAIGLTA